MARAKTTPTKAPRAAKPPRRRQQEILDAAARVFHEKGYESTSIQDIADAVGILKGSLYYYINSKEDLLFEILEAAHTDALSIIAETRAVEGSALQRVRKFVTLHVRFNAENLVRMGVFFQDFRSLSPERRRVIVEDRDHYDQFLRSLIREGQQEGVICPDLDPKLTAIAILGMMNWIYHWYRPGAGASAAELAENYADFVVAALACSRETHTPGHRGELAPVQLDPGGSQALLS
jgi:AcrR family transcriptional regulator